MRLLLILVAAGYELPDPGAFAPPDATRAARIEKALAIVRTGEGGNVDAAVRDLALCGETALPAIVKRLNEAGGGEKLLLLAAASPMAQGAALLEQARSDPHPAVRAWAQGPPHEREPALRDLAREYLDLLAAAEPRTYGDVATDLRPLRDGLGQRPATVETLRRRIQDSDVQNAVRKERERSATRFAVAGARALARGEIAPDLADAVFVAYVGLLREEDGNAAARATAAIVAKGEAAAPALEQLLDRENHDPRKIARILCSVRPDGGRGLYADFERRLADVQSALLDIAPGVLEGADLLSLLEHAALLPDESVRTAALDALLELPPPAGRDPARSLLDPQRFRPSDFKRAAELLARCGELEQLAPFAALHEDHGPARKEPGRGVGRSGRRVEDGEGERDHGGPPEVPAGPLGDAPQLSSLRAAAQTALRGATGPAVENMGKGFLGAEAKGLRTLGIDLVRDPATLLAYARSEPASDLARAAVLRLLSLDPGSAEAALDLLAARGIPADTPVLQILVACGRVDLLVGLGATSDVALHALANLPILDGAFEERLLALHDGAPALRKRTTLAALVPLGTEQARLRLEAAHDLALPILRQRADAGFRIPFAFPLARFLDGADGARLRLLADVAEASSDVEPGFFFALYRAWEGVEGSGTGEGVTYERARLLDSLSRTPDAASAKLLFDLLLKGETRDPKLARGTLMVAARLLDAKDLVRLLPLLREQVKEERPRSGTESPPWSGLRAALLRGGFNALGFARVEAALDDLCDILLDPTLQPAAFEWRRGAESWAPYWALDAMRDFPLSAVEPAFRRALERAEADGRLAACDPGDLLHLVAWCRTGLGKDWWTRGRAAYEVSVALCEALERMPGSDDATFEKMLALGGLGRYAEAAAAARAEAARRRALGFDGLDGQETPESLDARARLYEALSTKDASALFAAAEAADDPFIWYLATRYLRFDVPDVELAARAGEAAVRGSAGLRRALRDGLASVRNLEGRPEEAIRLLDPHERVPAKRVPGGLWHEALFAAAYLQRGDEWLARHALERAVRDRRLLPYLRADPAFARFADVFRDADDNHFYDVLFAPDSEE